MIVCLRLINWTLSPATSQGSTRSAAIRQEYAHVPEPLYRAGRAAILSRFLEGGCLFADPVWAERLEAQARANLTREIAALTA